MLGTQELHQASASWDGLKRWVVVGQGSVFLKLVTKNTLSIEATHRPLESEAQGARPEV